MKDNPNIRVELTGFREQDPSVVEMVNKIIAKHLNRIAEVEHPLRDSTPVGAGQ